MKTRAPRFVALALAVLLAAGPAFAQDADMAALTVRANAGDTDAMVALGVAWFTQTLTRVGAADDDDDDGAQAGISGYQQAVRWFRTAAEKGNAAAMFSLGAAYYDGQGVEKSTAEAIRWLTMGAEMGEARAMYNLSYIYADGRNVPHNLPESFRWMKRAAEAGDATAM